MKKYLAFTLSTLFLAACGGGGGGGSYADLKNKFDNPTGDLQKDNVKNVAAALAEKSSEKPPVVGALSSAMSVEGAATTGAGGVQCETPTSYTGGSVDVTCTCSGGGDITYTFDPMEYQDAADGGPCATAYSYNNCSMDGASMIDGTGTIFMANCMDAQQGYCFTFEGTVDGEAADIEYCLDENGEIWFLVEVEGGLFAVKGSYDPDTGDGDWYVKDMDGEWHCTATGGSGSCENSATGETFDF